MKRIKGGIWLAVLVLFTTLSSSIVSAAFSPADIPNLLNNGFQKLFTTLNQQFVQAGVTLLFFFMLLYAIFYAASKRLKIFQSGEGLSSQGKAFAFALSALAIVGVFFAARQSFFEVVRRILETMSVLAMVAFGIVVFLLMYYGFSQGDKKKPCMGLVATGLAFILPSMIKDWPGWYSFGWLLVIIGGIWCLIGMFSGGGGDKSDGGHGDPDSSDGSHNNSNNNNNSNNKGDANGKGDKGLKKKPDGLDNEHPGRIRVLVTTADDNPIPKAHVKIYALGMKWWRRAFGRHTSEYMMFNGYTGPDGLWPSRPSGELIGSGPIKIVVHSRFGNMTTEAFVQPNEGEKPQVFHITVGRRGEREEAFEPVVLNVEPQNNYNDLNLTGVVR